MPIALDPKRRDDFIIEAERGTPDTATVFQIRALTYRQRRDIEDKVHSLNHATREVFTNAGLMRMLRLRYGLTGWRNFKAANGDPIKFDTDANGNATDATLDFIDDDSASEISDAIAELSELPKADRD
jgi:hypothetical protein